MKKKEERKKKSQHWMLRDIPGLEVRIDNTGIIGWKRTGGIGEASSGPGRTGDGEGDGDGGGDGFEPPR